jgi:hypothetical protein
MDDMRYTFQLRGIAVIAARVRFGRLQNTFYYWDQIEKIDRKFRSKAQMFESNEFAIWVKDPAEDVGEGYLAASFGRPKSFFEKKHREWIGLFNVNATAPRTGPPRFCGRTGLGLEDKFLD